MFFVSLVRIDVVEAQTREGLKCGDPPFTHWPGRCLFNTGFTVLQGYFQQTFELDC